MTFVHQFERAQNALAYLKQLLVNIKATMDRSLGFVSFFSKAISGLAFIALKLVDTKVMQSHFSNLLITS